MGKQKMNAERGEVVVYKAEDGQISIDVRLADDTVWLTQAEMERLFQRKQQVISHHIRNIFKEKELEEKSNTQKIDIANSDRPIGLYSLNVIIAVGYRVNSKRGTQFRIWATRTLKEHLLRGFTVNQRRLQERGLIEMQQTVDLLAKTLKSHALVTGDGQAVLDVVQRYTRAWRLLLEYDEGRLAELPAKPIAPSAKLSLDEARAAAAALREDLATRKEAGSLFGQERGHGLAGVLGAIEQTFDGKPLYPSVQARAAHLLYFVIKDHPFGDGNKRLGALFFLEYLRRNGLLMHADGSPRFADNAMVALALLIAESEPSQKELMIRLVLNLLGDR